MAAAQLPVALDLSILGSDAETIFAAPPKRMRCRLAQGRLAQPKSRVPDLSYALCHRHTRRVPKRGACESMRLSPCVLVQPDGWARGEREGYGGPCDVTSLSLG